jgi:hypothetical protein
MVLVEAPILGSRVAWASSDLVQAAGVSPRVFEGPRASARLVLISQFLFDKRVVPTCRAAFVSRHIRGPLRLESARTICAARIGGYVQWNRGDGSMSRSRILPAILVVLPASVLLSLNTGVTGSIAGECRAKPGPSGPQGTHWHYRVSRPDQRRCWFLSLERVKVHSHIRKVVSDLASASRTAAPDPTVEGDSSADTAAASPLRPTSVKTVSLRAPAAPAPAETVPAAPSVGEDETAAHFSARWPSSSKFWDFDVREFAVIPSSYAENYSVADADEQTPLEWPGTAASRTRPPLDVAGETAWRAIFQVGMLLLALLAIAGGAFSLALRFRQSHSPDRRRVPDELPAPREVDKELADRNAGVRARQDRHASRPLTPTDPADDLKKSLAELMADLRRARTSRYAPRSFAPRKLGASLQRRLSARELLPPIDGWGQPRVDLAAAVEKAPTRSAPARVHAPTSDLPRTTVPASPSLVPA